MTDEDMSLVFAFPDGSAAFVHGFEAGTIWQQIDGEGALEIDRGYETGLPIHTENLDLYRRMAAARSYAIEARPTEYEEWTAMRLRYTGVKARPRLSIV